MNKEDALFNIIENSLNRQQEEIEEQRRRDDVDDEVETKSSTSSSSGSSSSRKATLSDVRNTNTLAGAIMRKFF